MSFLVCKLTRLVETQNFASQVDKGTNIIALFPEALSPCLLMMPCLL